MHGREVMLKHAYPYNMEMVELAAGSCEFLITRRLLGIVADTYAYPLYQHLRPRLGLPRWGQLLYEPWAVPGARLVRHSEVTEPARYATLAPLDGAELEIYRITPILAGTLYTFDLDYRKGMRLLQGLSYYVLANLSLWFAHSAPEIGITFEQYLHIIATLHRL